MKKFYSIFSRKIILHRTFYIFLSYTAITCHYSCTLLFLQSYIYCNNDITLKIYNLRENKNISNPYKSKDITLKFQTERISICLKNQL